MKITGQCHCGAIRYEADVDPAKVNACHCTDCQKFSGAPYRVSVRAPKESFRLLSGTPKIYVKTAESGNKRAQAFCADCGSAIYAAAVPDPDAYMLRVGGIDQRAELPPQRQIWCRSALPWSQDLQQVPKTERQ
jgi:hypothetical protein